jgi:Eco57I restriction endonuclease.
MKLQTITPLKALNKAYLKQKVARAEIDLFKTNLVHFLRSINELESEEHLKNLIVDFLKDTWYKGMYEINTKDRNDLVIHTGKTTKEAAGVIIEVKKPSNRAEMVLDARPNSKALQELVLYYLRERIDLNNTDIKYLIVTNIFEWYIIDEVWFEKNIFRNHKLTKDYNSWKLSGKDTKFFYESIAKPHLDAVSEQMVAVYFDIRTYERFVLNANERDDTKLIPLYKVLSPTHLLKQPFANDSNSLNTRFYSELLYIIGLEEVKEGSKHVIKRKAVANEASLIENAIIKLEDKDVLGNVNSSAYISFSKEERLYNVALELAITWINRILFLKLLEAQLFNYHKGDRKYLFLNYKLVHDFDELSNLFFLVLAENVENRRSHLKEKFANVPYLNSSLFERTQLERQTINVSELDNRLQLPLFGSTVLKDDKGKRRSGALPTLQYLFEFLDAYDFTSEGGEEIQEQNKNLINASVLGLIFEKINGYKDGSFFTPGVVTMYMCKETIRKCVLQKFNEVKGWNCESIDGLYNKIDDKKEANEIINSLRICDPAVGSGHFLVSVLNEMIAIKSELKILQDKNGRSLRDYHIEVVNDELVVTDDDGKLFEYNPLNKESQRVQETLFHEKETIIEGCLFGVDINQNSVKICRLRLWIELLKNAYYTPTSNFHRLETLPNIDINIKCGNSLISRFSLGTDIKSALRNSKWTIKAYKSAVQSYREAETKEQKRELEELIENIKKDFRSYISPNDPKYKRLSKLRGDLFNLSQTQVLFVDGKKGDKETKKKIEKLNVEIEKLETSIEEIKTNKVYEEAFEWRLEFPEILNEQGDFIGFDVVIGNPPYGVQFNAQEKKFIRENYKSYQYKFDSYVYFIERGINLLKPNGILEYITPILWLTLDNCYPIRSIIIQENDLIRLFIHGEGVFDEAVVSTLSFQLRKGNAKEELSILNKNSRFVTTKSKWIDGDSLRIEYRMTPEEKKIVDKIRLKSVALSTFGEVIQGITPYDSYRGQSKEIIESRAYHFDFKRDETCGPWLEGKNLSRYLITWGSMWLSYGDWLAAPREKRFFEGPRILFREVPGKGRRIQAALTDDEYYYGHSISPFKAFENYEVDLEYFLGVVNSKLISWYGHFTLPNFGKDIFPKLNPNDIKELPIPARLEHREEISKLVRRIMLTKGQNASADTSEIENEIDLLLYKIYGLSNSEIELIEQMMNK